MRHLRVDDKTWQKATARASREGTSVSSVVRLFLEQYAAGTVTITPARIESKED